MRIRHSLTHVPGLPVFKDEKVPKPADPENFYMINQQVLNLITSKLSFNYHTRKGQINPVSVFVCASLLKVSFVADIEKSILVTEILSVEKENSSKRKSSSENQRRKYFFHIKTTKKEYLLSTEKKQLRRYFVKGLKCIINLGVEFMGSMVLKKYCESVIKVQHNNSAIRTLNKSCRSIISRQNSYQVRLELVEKEIISQILQNIITQIEIDEKCEECNNYELNFKNNLSEFKSLTVKQENLRENIRKKNQKIEKIETKVTKVQEKIHHFYLNLGITNLGISTFKIWTLVLEHLQCSEIFTLRTVNSKMRKQTDRSLSYKPLWRVLSLGKLSPRGLMYRLYTNLFYKTRIKGLGFDINQDTLYEIHSDVWNGLSQYQIETEEVLIGLCKYNPNLEYCQGMHFVCNFLLNILKDSEQTLKIMDSLCRPPFYLSELWKNDFSRLRLGIYQLDFIMKIRLPLLHKHIKRLEIPLDMIISKWFLTVFTHFYFQYDVNLELVQGIWDIFLVKGWSALISTALGIFYLNERNLLEQGYEETLMILTTRLSCDGIQKVIPKFEVDLKILEDLESSHASME